MAKTANEVLRQIKDEGIELIDLKFVDLHGKWQHLTVCHDLIDESAFTEQRLRRADLNSNPLEDGTLADYQQHGLHNFLTRGEDASAWSSNIDGVIGAVNRESFQWP